MLICSICKGKAATCIEIDCGRFNHRFFYCKEHKPKKARLIVMGKKQIIQGEGRELVID